MKMPIYSMSSGGDTTTRGSQSTNTATLLFQIISNSTKILYEDDSSTTEATEESSLLQEFLHYLDGAEAEEASSRYFSSLPQYLSFHWVLHDDEYIHQKLQLLQMNNDDEHLRQTVLERYVLGVMYYSSKANTTTSESPWSSPDDSVTKVTETTPASSSRVRSSMDKSWLLKSNLSVCEWYGVECNNDSTSKNEGRNDNGIVIIGLDLGI